MTKPTDVANTETSTAIAWYSTYPTVLLFQGDITSVYSLAGRQVMESPNGSPSDTCNKAGDSTTGNGYFPYHLSGGGWFVGFYYFNSWYDYDYAGVTQDYVAYYRSKGRTPCSMAAPQAMKIYTRGGVGSVQYYSDTLQISLPDDTNVGVERGGVWGWRTWQCCSFSKVIMKQLNGVVMMKSQNAFLAIAGFLGLLCYPLLVFAQTKSIGLATDNYRPLFSAVHEIEKISGVPINYEDIRCDFPGDQKDITALIGVTPAQLALHGSVKDIVPRGGSLAATIAVDASTGRLTDADAVYGALNAVVSAYNSSTTLPGQFQVLKANGEFFLEPTAIRNTSGETVSTQAVLATPITIPSKPRVAADTLNLIVQQVSNASGFKIGIGSVPINTLAMTQNTFEANREPAREVLGRFLNSLLNHGPIAAPSSSSLTYAMLYDVQLKYYMLNIEEVGSVSNRYLQAVPPPPPPLPPGGGRPGLRSMNQ